ncbi:putative secreted beta-glucosidase SIM1 [Wickerhamiella sorbophila]|uniref:Putative secreted beta-glucosidase SIM1 n=1 Tax=Wickerhamiella sorbophila TaxID=45607 RepID=A0A2T0FC06_9ASCO|nr:putative secreted beta-glucosidase SIM1 [Wickerhamiella sorbophila]PRT52543.1 putative secreted beta-glucosidase SIM1 [Wickerhamiella sorbophila]
MKSSVLASTLIASMAAYAMADDLVLEHHVHAPHKRALVTEVVYQTILVDQAGNIISEGVAAAPPQTESAPAAAAPVTTSQAAAAPAPTTSEAAASPAATTSQAAAAPVESVLLKAGDNAASSAASSSASTEQTTSSSSGGAFQDGVIDCSDFPAGNGVVALDYLGFGGWSGIQFLNGGSSSSGSSCTEGAYCSYACQPGMSKTQWPSNQPASGVSVGGLQCKGGKLYRTNTNTDNLCEAGAGTASVESELSQDVAICRTDYPGTENMVIPTLVKAGSSNLLTVVVQESYYQWQGKPTSAQYYVNNAGVSVEDGCVWGTPGSGVGNWAPLNFGAGQASGVTYLSLIPNPNNRSPANFNVKIVSDGGNVIGNCVYENGSYNGGANGCTVSVTSGKAKFVLY